MSDAKVARDNVTWRPTTRADFLAKHTVLAQARRLANSSAHKDPLKGHQVTVYTDLAGVPLLQAAHTIAPPVDYFYYVNPDYPF